MLVDGVVVIASGVELKWYLQGIELSAGIKGKYGRQAALNSLMVDVVPGPRV